MYVSEPPLRKDIECRKSWLEGTTVFYETNVTGQSRGALQGLSLSSNRKNRSSFQLLAAVAMGTVSNKYLIAAGQYF